MLRSLYTAATGMEAEQTKMDVISHNLANVNTAGFKRVRAEFEDLLSERIRGASAPDATSGGNPTPLEVGLGVRTAATNRTYSQGDMLVTQNPYDLAVEGQGFFRVTQPNGEVAYTRAGNLRVDAEGRLATPRGDLIDPQIRVPSEATAVNISRDGTVTATVPNRVTPVELGTIELTTFQNPSGLESLGGNLLRVTGASGEGTVNRPGENGAGLLAQGYLEGSNVQAVEEMVDLISTQRSYELNSKVIQTADQMLQRLTSLR